MGEYQVVDWLIDNADRDDFKTKDSVEEALQRLDKDNKLEGWKQKDGRWYERVNKSKRRSYNLSLKDWVRNINDDYYQEQKKKLDAADTVEDMEAIDKKFDPNYEQKTYDKFRDYLEERREALVDSDVVKEAQKVINKATRVVDLDIIDLDDIESRSNKATRNVIAELIKDTSGDLEDLETTKEREISQQISEANTLAELNAIDVSRALTTRSEESLELLKESKRIEILG